MVYSLNKDKEIILSDYIFEVSKFAEKAGIDVSRIMKESGIIFSDYKQNPHPISVNTCNDLVSKLYCEFKIPYLGLAMGQQMRLTCHGMAGVSAMAQQTYGEALEAASRLCDTVFPIYSMLFSETKQHVGLSVSERISLSPNSNFYIELIFVNFYNILHFLLGDKYEPKYISFSHPEPKYSKVYSRYFKCKIIFDADINEFAVSPSVAKRELLLANRGIASMAEHTYANDLHNIDLDFLPQKLRLILIQSAGAFPSLETAARKIGISSRTLRRQLNSLGTNYQAELDTLRKEFAINYLTKSNKNITEIALRLGYCDTSSFSNAFKKWTGMSPIIFRKSNSTH